jgi:hypothetical protein
MVQPELFPISALQTKGYAQPEPRDGVESNDTAEPQAEAA